MKICFTSIFAHPLFYPSSSIIHGGSEVQLFQLAQKIAQDSRFNVSFFVADCGQLEKIINRIKVLKAFPIKRIRFKYLLGAYYQILFFIKLIRLDADVHFQRAAGIETGIIALYCKLFGKKFLYMTASSIDTDKGYRKMKPIEGLFYEFGLRNASKVICQNKEQELQLKHNYHINSVVVKNSFEIPHQTIPNKKYILWVGTSQPLKQPQIYLDLARSLSKYQFTIIIPKHDIEIWQNIYRQSKTILNLKFIEKVPFEGINDYFAEAKLFVNTSTFEGFPNTFVQSAMNRTPIISLSVNPDNFLNKNKCGFCAQGNFEKLKKYTQKLMTNQKLWLQMSQNAYNYALKNHNINNNIKKLIQLF